MLNVNLTGHILLQLSLIALTSAVHCDETNLYENVVREA